MFPTDTPAAVTTVSMQGMEVCYYYNQGQADTSQMGWLLKQGIASSFPVPSWTYSGAAALAHVTGQLPVTMAGRYSLMVTTGDAFVIAVNDKWLFMERVDESGQDWEASVTCAAAGDVGTYATDRVTCVVILIMT